MVHVPTRVAELRAELLKRKEGSSALIAEFATRPELPLAAQKYARYFDDHFKGQLNAIIKSVQLGLKPSDILPETMVTLQGSIPQTDLPIAPGVTNKNAKLG